MRRMAGAAPPLRIRIGGRGMSQRIALGQSACLGVATLRFLDLRECLTCISLPGWPVEEQRCRRPGRLNVNYDGPVHPGLRSRQSQVDCR